MIERSEFLKRIQSNIDKAGYHTTVVLGDTEPRYAYTIGCKEVFGSELIFAGGEAYTKYDVSTIIGRIYKELKNSTEWESVSVELDSLGTFSLVSADKSWVRLLALGVFDYYKQNEISALQITPDQRHYTLDIPDLSKEFSIELSPVWQWLVREWDFPVPRDSTAATNLEVLYGAKATELTRWETNEWEIFCGAGPDVPKEDIRIVPLAILIGIDKSLEPALRLEVGKGLWRDSVELVWNDWG